MTFRSPIRNEWDRVAAQFAAAALREGREGAIARAMCDVMPVFIAMVERERDKETDPRDFFDAVASVCGAMIEEAIEKTRVTMPKAAALDRMLNLIARVVKPRVAATKSGLIVPEGFH